MIFDGKIKELMTCDISQILANLPDQSSPLWMLHTGRQEDNNVHADTLNLLIKGVGKYWNGVFVPPKTYDGYPPDLVNAVISIAEDVARKVGGVVTNATLIMLPAGKEVFLHKDSFPLNLIHRCHIPIITNDKCTFTLLNKDFFLQPGVIYEINNQLPHAAKNGGETPRIHLLVDILPNENS